MMSYKSISSTTITDYKRYIHDYNMSGIGFVADVFFVAKVFTSFSAVYVKDKRRLRNFYLG